MRCELIETDGGWIVQCDGAEVAHHSRQAEALEDVAQRLRACERDTMASLAVRFDRLDVPRAS